MVPVNQSLKLHQTRLKGMPPRTAEEIGVDSLSFDDLYNNLRVFESDVKGSTSSSLSRKNVAFCLLNTSIYNDLPDYTQRWNAMLKPPPMTVSTARASGTKNFRTARQSFNRQTVLTYAAMEVNTVKSTVNRVRPANVFHKTHSPFSRPFKNNQKLAFITLFHLLESHLIEQQNKGIVAAANYPHRALQNKGIVDSGCSRHMTRNKAYLVEYQDFNGGPIAFGGSKGYITGKGKIKIGKLDFEDVCFVKELQHFNLFSVLQICDKKNKVLFTDSKCLVLSPEFKLPDANQVLLRIPRQNNMYSFNLENIVPSGEFKNRDFIEFCGSKGIKREYSNARTPQQNGVAERKNMTLIKAARTMLADSFLPNTFWATEAVQTDMCILHLSASSTNIVNTISTPVSTASSYSGLSFNDLTNTDQDDSEIPALEEIYDNPTDGIFTNSSYDDEGAVADFTNLEPIVNVSPIPTLRITSIHPSTLILGDPQSAVQTRSKVTKSSRAHAFEELLQFKIQKVWNLVDLPYGKKAIGTKWVYRNKKDERGVVVRNKASAFLYGKIDEEVYVSQPPGFIDPKYPKKVYKVVKALYGLHQTPRAWYATLSTFLLKNGYRRGTIDKTLFLKKDKHDIILVQVYVDDIIFGSTKKSWCDEFEALMKSRFQMSSMGELTFFLGLQVKQKADGIFISQDKYVAEILKKFDFVNVKTASTPIETQKPLVKDEEASDVDVHLYRSMIGSLMYLTASRPDIMFAVCACSRFQVTPKTSHLSAVKRIFRYLKGKPKLGLWYPRVSSFDLEAYSDSDYAGANLDRKSTTGGCQFLGRRLISWQCKKQTIVATSTTEAEYVAAASCCGQNPVYHSKTKHIAIRHHFIRDAYEKKLIQVLKIHTDDNVADLLTKAFDVSSSLGFRESLGRALDGTEALMLPKLFILWLATVSTDSAELVPMGKVSTAIETLKKNTAKALISLSPMITHSQIMAVLESCPKHNMVAYLEKTNGNDEFHEIIDFLT
ncbi:putative ribonuclease H-like domain-containing protein [Tanacetum coccineum]